MFVPLAVIIVVVVRMRSRLPHLRSRERALLANTHVRVEEREGRGGHPHAEGILQSVEDVFIEWRVHRNLACIKQRRKIRQ